MPKSPTLKNTIDDSLSQLPIPDFSGGLNSETDPQDLQPNESPDCQNVKVLKNGRLIGRDGFVARVTGLPAAPDGAYFFYDSLGARRLVVWSNGALYDCTTYAATLIQAGVYTAGNRVCFAQLNNICYFSDGETIFTSGPNQSGVYYWDPVVSPGACTLLISSAAVGSIATPAAKCMAAPYGQLVLGRLKYVGGTYAKHAVIWSNVNDPTTIIGTNIFQIGQGQGGEINCLVPMATSSLGVNPYSAIFVGKSKAGVFQLKGALTPSTASEVLINAPTGVLDGATVQFIPGPDGAGYMVWLGTDNKVWYTNGVTSGELSKSIRKELSQYIEDRFSSSASSIFTSVRNNTSFQYVLDVGGGRQYCYDWDLKVWTRYVGWPSGYWADAKDGNGQSVIFCADQTNKRLVQCDIGTTDGGVAISPYWKTGYLGSGDDVSKVWQWIYVAFMTDTGDITIVATTNLGQGGQAIGTLTITAANSIDARWDVATWDSSVWVSGGAATYTPYKRKKRLTRSTSGLDGSTELLVGDNVQLKLSTSVSGAHFELLGCNLLYLPRGRARVAAS